MASLAILGHLCVLTQLLLTPCMGQSKVLKRRNYRYTDHKDCLTYRNTDNGHQQRRENNFCSTIPEIFERCDGFAGDMARLTCNPENAVPYEQKQMNEVTCSNETENGTLGWIDSLRPNLNIALSCVLKRFPDQWDESSWSPKLSVSKAVNLKCNERHGFGDKIVTGIANVVIDRVRDVREMMWAYAPKSERCQREYCTAQSEYYITLSNVLIDPRRHVDRKRAVGKSKSGFSLSPLNFPSSPGETVEFDCPQFTYIEDEEYLKAICIWSDINHAFIWMFDQEGLRCNSGCGQTALPKGSLLDFPDNEVFSPAPDTNIRYSIKCKEEVGYFASDDGIIEVSCVKRENRSGAIMTHYDSFTF